MAHSLFPIRHAHLKAAATLLPRHLLLDLLHSPFLSTLCANISFRSNTRSTLANAFCVGLFGGVDLLLVLFQLGVIVWWQALRGGGDAGVGCHGYGSGG